MDEQNQNSVSTGDWMTTMLISYIPIIGFIMLFVWAFGSSNPSKANWAKAMLLWMLIAVVLGGLLFAAFGAALFSAFQ
ncbi:hypothetical protein OAL15_03550 [Flavobacteriales bacterium]|nr:hypothetical protein [Flavobacteriales bacterium]